MGHTLLLLVLYLCLTGAHSAVWCGDGYYLAYGECVDDDECKADPDDPDFIGRCGANANCINIEGSFLCQCMDGYRTTTNLVNFTGFTADYSEQCKDINECQQDDICGKNATCKNTIGSFFCVCDAGFVLKSGRTNFSGNHEWCEDICVINNTICGNGTCLHGASGHYCACHSGFSNYGNVQSRCTELNCEIVKDMTSLKENFAPAYELMVQLTDKCEQIAGRKNATQLDGGHMLKNLSSVIDEVLYSKPIHDNKKVSIHNNRKISTLLDTIEDMLRFMAPFSTPPGVKKSSNYTELELRVYKGSVFPQGNVTLSLEHATLDIQMETVAGEPSQYPGFCFVSFLSYTNLVVFANVFFNDEKKQDGETFELISKVVTVTVSNRNTSLLQEPVLITFNLLQQLNGTSHCVFWNSSMEGGGGAWSSRGCIVKESSPQYTVCSCDHLSSFAVLMALYEVEDRFELQLITWVGLSLSLLCLFICILTFGLIRSIQNQRTRIHLHLSISLFLAFFIFLIGISRTENWVGCAVVAGLLHFFFLASFCWMCLEGIQLFRMTVVVFTTSFRTVYMMAAGYGVPAVIVAITALVNAKGYGTERYCWLSLDSIWSFFGPACVIIFINIIFFLITMWKLAQKFSSLNPDCDNLKKIRTFTITAVAQLCVLGTTWIFGCFQFEEKTIAMSYLFTIFASLQGVLLFVMHCLCSKQIRDEYRSILSRYCAPQEKTCSEFSNTHSSKEQRSKSTQETGEFLELQAE